MLAHRYTKHTAKLLGRYCLIRPNNSLLSTNPLRVKSCTDSDRILRVFTTFFSSSEYLACCFSCR